MTIDELSPNDDTTTHTRTKRDDDEVLHPTSSTIGHFSDSSSVGIIGQYDPDTDTILDHLCQGNLALPR